MMIDTKAKRAVLTPLFIVSVVLMVINDHLLKGSGLIHHTITGKISDVAFLFFTPILVVYVFRVKNVPGLIISYLAVSCSFIAINLSGCFSHFVESLFALIHIPLTLWPDKTDLIALVVLPFSLWFLLGARKEIRLRNAKTFELGIVAFAVIACAATSPHYTDVMPISHEPIYMSWEEFRTSVKVLPPKEILKKGKIYVMDNHLYINEPNKGIHVFDNSNPKKPIAKCFINIPGNIDISIKGSYLYADSFVDLLVFALTIYPEDILLVNRIKEVFPYNPYQTKPVTEEIDPNREVYFYPEAVDKERGVVVGWQLYGGRKQL